MENENQKQDNSFDLVAQFDEELQAVNESLEDVDSLYEEIKKHFDMVKGSFKQGSLSFVERQTSNLISLKSTRISLLKERINIKKTKADLYLKNKRLENPEDSGSNPALLRDIASMLMNKDVAVNQIEDDYVGTVDGQIEAEQTEDLSSSVDDLLASRLEELKKSGELELSDNEKSILLEKKQVTIVVVRKGKSWKYAAMDQDGKFVKDYPVPDKKENPIKLQREDGEIIAVDKDEKVYKVINIKE